MPCYHPQQAWRTPYSGPSGKLGITFNRKKALLTHPITLPCGNCIGCRLDRSREWAIRLMHEKQSHELSTFLTLTYEEEPTGQTLVKKHPVDFMKRLRDHHGRNNDNKLKFFLCGEYGEQLSRPHYHAIIFGCDFADKRPFRKNKHEQQLFVSKKLDDIWGHGHCFVGNVEIESASYVARYILKKVTGAKAEEYYKGKQPEYITMSKGIGAKYYEKYKDSMYARDFVTIKGSQAPIPAYYDKKMEIENPELLVQLKSKRQKYANDRPQDSTTERLLDREEHKARTIIHFSQRGLK